MATKFGVQDMLQMEIQAKKFLEGSKQLEKESYCLVFMRGFEKSETSI